MELQYKIHQDSRLEAPWLLIVNQCQSYHPFDPHLYPFIAQTRGVAGDHFGIASVRHHTDLVFPKRQVGNFQAMTITKNTDTIWL